MNWDDFINDKQRASLSETVAKYEGTLQLAKSIGVKKQSLQRAFDKEMDMTLETMYKRDKAENEYRENKIEIERNQFLKALQEAQEMNRDKGFERQPG